MAKHVFGGIWTEDKILRVRRYLSAYTTIFKKNEAARYFRTMYVDAFAGTGSRERPEDDRAIDLFSEEQTEAGDLLAGSATIALEVEPPFDRYVFIDKKGAHVDDLGRLKKQYPEKADSIDVRHGDANDILRGLCRETDWERERGVLFLDPYGMQVEWSVIEVIAGTRAIDVWILFPLGMAVNRMLTTGRLPPKLWREALTRTFGSDNWMDEFYHRETVETLFGKEHVVAKDANFERIGQFFVKRLKSVFADAADNPRPLRNSKNVPLFLLCFAVGNQKARPTAMKIASHILGMQ